MNKLADLEIFAAVAAQRSFTRAAERLGFPKSSVSRRIKALEVELGVKLIYRSNRRFELTDQGTVLLDRSEQVLRSAERAFDEVRDAQQGLRGLISISSTADLALMFLADALAEFKRENPDIRIYLDATPRTLDFASDRIDLALRVGPLRDSSLVARKLSDRPLRLFATPGYLKPRGIPRNIKELESHVLIATRRMSVGGASLQPSLQVNSMGLIRELTLRGAGIGLLDPASIPLDRRETLVPVLETASTPVVPIFLVFPHRNPPRRVSELAKKIERHHQRGRR